MNKFERRNKLDNFLNQVNGSIKNKNKLQKLIYLLQQSGEDFDQEFEFYQWGIFSRTLAYDLDDAIAEGKYLQIKNSTPFKINGNSIEDLLSEKPQLLETLSTIIYLKSNFYKINQLKTKLKELNPKLIDHYPKAFNLAQKLYNLSA